MKQHMNNPSVALISLYDHHAFGIRNIHGLLRENGFNSNIIFFKELLWGFQEPSGMEIDLLLEKIMEINPDVIGFSVRSPFFKIAKEITNRLKPLNKLIIWGNTHATVEPEQCIKHADIVCIGDGEIPMLEMMKNIKNKKSIKNINNLWVKEEGMIMKNPIGELKEDLNEVSFYDLTVDFKYSIENDKITNDDPKLTYSKYDIMVGRGCPYSCTYCSNSYLHKLYKGKGKFVRFRSVEHCIKELSDAKEKLGIKEVFFYDEVFIIDNEWLDDFLKEYDKKINLPFSLCLHPLMVTDDVIKKLKTHGLERVGIGIQSGSERVRFDVYKRYVTDKKLIEVSEIFNKYGVAPTYDIILDNPYENSEDLENGLNLFMKLKRPYHINVFSLTNFPKTDLTNMMNMDNKKQINPEEDLFNYKMNIKNERRDEENKIYNIKISLFSKSFVPKIFIKNINNKTVLFMVFKMSSFIKLSIMGTKAIFTGKINKSLVKYYFRNYIKFKNFQR